MPTLSTEKSLRLVLPIVTLFLVASCSHQELTRRALLVTSPVLTDGGKFPAKYTCSGAGVSPPFSWSSVPAQTKSIGITLTDPDAPGGEFTHWVLYNLPTGVVSLPENVAPTLHPACGGIQARNDFGQVGYGGPCPPPGAPHRYVLRVYAEDCTIAPGDARADIAALKAHAVAVGELSATFGR